MAEFLADRNSACTALNTAVLQGHCFVSTLEYLHLKSNYAKFDKKWLSYGPIRDSTALHGILKCYRVYVLCLDKIIYTLRVIMSNFSLIR